MDSLPPGWEKDSATLYLHESGVRIEKRVYREQEGWILVPVDLDTPVSTFGADKDGLAQAFAAWSKGAAKTKAKPAPAKTSAKAKAKAKKKAAEEEDAETPKDEDAEEGEDGEDGDEEGGKKKKKAEEEDEGDDD